MTRLENHLRDLSFIADAIKHEVCPERNLFLSTEWVLVLYLCDRSPDYRNVDISQSVIATGQQPLHQAIFTTAYTSVTTSLSVCIFKSGTLQSEITHLYCIRHHQRFSASTCCSDNWSTSTFSAHLFLSVLIATGSASCV